jgi:lysozyme
MNISDNGLNLIKDFEGIRLSAYPDSSGVWTIGYGSTQGVHPGMVISLAQADQMLRNEISTDESYVTAVVNVDIAQSMFDAMVSFTYNIGQGNFQKSSVLRLVNIGDFISAANAFLLWNKAGGIIVPGLTRRRQAERKLFLQGVASLQSGFVAASPVVEPLSEPTVPDTDPADILDTTMNPTPTAEINPMETNMEEKKMAESDSEYGAQPYPGENDGTPEGGAPGGEPTAEPTDIPEHSDPMERKVMAESDSEDNAAPYPGENDGTPEGGAPGGEPTAEPTDIPDHTDPNT